jgi:riboflavin synthase
MFTGIISELGTVEALERGDGGARLRVRAGLAARLEPVGSIAVGGVCLTAAALGDGGFEADVMNQTLTHTTLGELAARDRVNLESPLAAGQPLGGHLVQGHVDAAGSVVALADDGIARRLRVELPVELRPYVAERGSVALDGVSLTVTAITDEGFEVSLIPETIERTTLGDAAEGDRLNVEVDMIARYVERLMASFGRET